MARPTPRDFLQQCLNDGLATHEIVERAQDAGMCVAVCGELVTVSSTLEQVASAMYLALRRPENAEHRQHTMRVFGPRPLKGATRM